jgi:phosphate acetyltransferase
MMGPTPGIGDTVTVRVTVREKRAGKNRNILDCVCSNQTGDTVIEGEAEVVTPTEKVRRPRTLLPEVHLHEHGARFQLLIAAAANLEPIKTAVVHPCDAVSLAGAIEAMRLGLIVPVLVGPRDKIEKAAKEAKLKLGSVEVIDTPHSHASAVQSVELAGTGKVAAPMKGALHTDELMGAIVRPDSGLKTERRMSHVFVFDVPHYPKPLYITDAAINIYPSLEDKRDIVQNAIDLAQALGVERPKMEILSAVETINPEIKSTVEAAALCKMSDRGQITGGVLDGPLAFDNADSTQAAKSKRIVSAVAGDADVLVVPDLESGNMVAKQLTYLAGADSAGVVLEARVPIILASRTDGSLARSASCAVAQLFVHRHIGAMS